MGSVNEIDKLPPLGAWDSHVHVFDEEAFPLHPLHSYHPRKADITALQGFHRNYGIAHLCIVAFSVYHTDYSSILDALYHLGGKGRAVACIDPVTVTDDELWTLHRAGVRGIRVNTRTRGDSLNIPEHKHWQTECVL